MFVTTVLMPCLRLPSLLLCSLHPVRHISHMCVTSSLFKLCLSIPSGFYFLRPFLPFRFTTSRALRAQLSSQWFGGARWGAPKSLPIMAAPAKINKDVVQITGGYLDGDDTWTAAVTQVGEKTFIHIDRRIGGCSKFLGGSFAMVDYIVDLRNAEVDKRLQKATSSDPAKALEIEMGVGKPGGITHGKRKELWADVPEDVIDVKVTTAAHGEASRSASTLALQ